MIMSLERAILFKGEPCATADALHPHGPHVHDAPGHDAPGHDDFDHC